MRHDESADHEENRHPKKISVNRSGDDVASVIKGNGQRRQATQKLDIDDHLPADPSQPIASKSRRRSPEMVASQRESHARSTKLSTTFFSPAFSNAIVSLLPST